MATTSTLSNILLDKEILLESGTNEVEILVFDVADFVFGINVAKVREVLPLAEITALPRAHRSIRGVFKLRNQVVPCVSLLEHLGIRPTRQPSESTLILTDLNQQQTAFLVDGVERIHRLSWEHVLPVPGLDALSRTPVTALARCDGRLILMLDFEMILDDVTEQYFRTDEVANPLGLPRENLRLLLAEDSPTVRAAIGNTLRASGYTQLIFFENGADAWKWVEDRYRQVGRVEEVGDLLIADIEMPQVDGLHLTKRIKEHPELRHIPVLLYSSIVTPDNRKKGTAVGADAQVAKPELTEVVRLADELIAGARRESRAQGLREIVGTSQPSSQPTPASPGSAARPPVDPRNPEPSAAPAAEPVLPSVEIPAVARSASEPAAAAAPGLSANAQARVAPQSGAGEPLALDEPGEPSGVDSRLWATFRHELKDRVARLRELLARAKSGDVSENVHRELARTLHTVKSASMVVPLDQITRPTHLAESLLESVSSDRTHWPHEELAHYTDWLASLTSEAHVDAALALGAPLEAELACRLAQ